MAFKTLYTVVSEQQLNNLKLNGFLSHDDDGNTDKSMNTWMHEQMRKRLPPSAFHQIAGANQIHYLFLEKEHTQFAAENNWLVLEISVPNESILYFDDNDYIYMTNVFSHLCYDDEDSYLADSEEDAKRHEQIAQEEVIGSWNKLFDPHRSSRDVDYCGDVELRATTPYISQEMVIKVIK